MTDEEILAVLFSSANSGSSSVSHVIRYFSREGNFLCKERIPNGTDGTFTYGDNTWSDSIGGDPIPNATKDVKQDMDLYYVGESLKLFYWDFTKSMIDEVAGREATNVGSITRSEAGLYFNTASQASSLGAVLTPDTTLNIVFGDMEFKGSTGSHETLISFGAVNSDNGFLFRYSGYDYWATYIGGWKQINNSAWAGADKRNIFANKKLSIYKDANSYISFYLDGELITQSHAALAETNIALGNSRAQSSGGQCFDAYVKKVYITEGLNF